MGDKEQAGNTNMFGRRTWDKEEYARRARERGGGATTTTTDEKKLSKYDFHKDREDQLHKIDQMNTLSFVSEQQSAMTGKRGKGIGFYCEICNLTYKNDLELVDHLNSKQHFHNAGIEYIDNRDITLEMIIDRVEKLAAERDRNNALELEGGNTKYDLAKRIEKRKEFETKLIQKRKAKKLKQKAKLQERAAAVAKQQAVADDDDVYNSEDSKMAAMMGFAGFGSTKNI